MSPPRSPPSPRRGPWVSLVLVGAVLWGLYRLARPPSPHEVEVRAATVAALEDDFVRQHGESPTPAQVQGLVDDWVERELLVREARARGLDRADPIVRRRLAQKMRFVLEQAEPVDDPGDEILQQWLDEHPRSYRRPSRRGFVHVFVAGHDASSQAQARRWVARLEAGEDPTGQGDAFAHGPVQGPADRAALGQRYGESFAQVVQAAPVGRWVAIESSFGWHAVHVDVEQPGVALPLAQVRDRVLADWQRQRRDQNLARGLKALRQRASVRVVP
ncbi:MAG: peptidylprolyl isomerase [Myxococcota bacterium]